MKLSKKQGSVKIKGKNSVKLGIAIIIRQLKQKPSSKKSKNHNESSLIEFPTSKSLKQSQSPLPKIYGTRVDQFEATLSSFQQLYRKEREISNLGYLQIQKRLDRLQYKAFSAQQDLRQLSDIRQIKPIRESISNSSITDTSKNEIMLLKQVILQDKEAHKQHTKHQNALIEQLSMKQLRTQQQLREMIAHQRMEYQYRLTGQGEEIRQIDSLKQRKMQQQYEMIKGVISNAQRKIYEELERKIRNQTVVKDYIEDKLAELKEELSNQHKQTISAEAKFIRQTKQSLESLFAMVNSFKKELSDELAQTQKLTVNNIKRISMSLDISRERSADELKQVSTMQQEINNEMVEMRNFVTTKLDENRQFMSEFEDQTNDLLQQSGATIKDNKGSTAIDHQKLSLFQKQMNQWKSITEQKNLNVFKEISNTLKTMKLEWRKQSDQTVSQVAALNESLKNLKKSGPNQLKKSVQTIITIFNNEFDVLAQELQTLTDMIALAKKENQKCLKQEVVKSKQETLEQVKSMLSQKSKENNLYIDKVVARSEQNTKSLVLKQVKYASEIMNQRVQKLEDQMGKLETAFKKGNLLTTSQLEDYSVKLKIFNDNYKDYLEEQRKDDMKKRMELEQAMRKNSNNLMDICYKKSEYLVDGLKKNIEISQMKEKVEAAQALDSAKDELKKELQASRQEFQKQLSTGIEKITKQRQNSEQVLHEAIQQSINNTKRNLTNDLGNTKLQFEEKINEMKIKEVQKEAEMQKQMAELKDSLFKMMREEKKLAEESILKNRKEVEDKVQKNLQARQSQALERELKSKRQFETLVNTAVSKLEMSQKQQLTTMKKLMEEGLSKNTKQVTQKISKLEAENKTQIDKAMKLVLQLKDKQGQLSNKLQALSSDVGTKDKAINDKLDQINTKIAQLKSIADKDSILIGQEKSKQALLQKKVEQLAKNIEIQKQASHDKMEQINAKIVDINTNSEKQNAKIAEEANQQVQIQKKIQQLTKNIDLQVKVTNDKIEQINSKITEVNSSLEKQNIKKQAELEKKVQQITKNVDIQNKITNDKIEKINSKIAEVNSGVEKQSIKKGEEMVKRQAQLEKRMQQLTKNIDIQNKTTNDKIEKINSKISEVNLSVEKQSIKKQAQLEKKVQQMTKNIDIQHKTTNDKIQQINSKITEIKTNVQKQGVKKGEEKSKKQLELEKKVQQLSKDVEAQKKENSDKVQQIKKQITEIKTNSDSDKIKINEEKVKSTELQKKIQTLSVDFDGKNKQLALKIEEINKKLTEQSTNSEKLKEKEGEGKKVGQQSLNQLRSDLQKNMKQMQIKISEIQSKDHSEEQEEQISSIRKSVNKLQAMVFSQQAKNKAIFDRLTQDVNKVSENLSLLTNQMRE